MLESIKVTINTMEWLGLVLAILVLVNTFCGTMVNIYGGEAFSWKKLFKGLGKSIVFYISAAVTGVAFTLLPYINEMISNNFNISLISNELLNTLSATAVLGVVVSTVIIQAKKALQGIIELANISIDKKEEITWDIIDPEEDKEKRGE